MKLFLKGLIIGIGKIIPGVSGAMLAINFNVYEKAIEAVSNFFYDWKNNLNFLLLLGSGIFISIVLCSNIVIYFLSNYMFVTLMLFIGLIMGGTYNFSRKIVYNKKSIFLIFLIMVLFLLISLGNTNYKYVLSYKFMDNIMFFLGGIIEIVASIVPGISGTALLMVMGIYDIVMEMIGNIFDVNYVINNINLYISYGVGMGVSFILTVTLINYLIKRYRNITYTVILGLCVSAIIFLIIMAFGEKIGIIEFILGMMSMMVGLLISCIFDK